MENWLQNAIKEFEEIENEPGDILTHDWLKWALNVPEPRDLEHYKEMQFVLLSRVESFKDYLLTEKKVLLSSVRGKGYMVVHPRDQARYAAEGFAYDLSKASKKADKYLTNTNRDALTSEENKRHLDTQMRINGVSSMISKESKDIFKRFLPTN